MIDAPAPAAFEVADASFAAVAVAGQPLAWPAVLGLLSVGDEHRAARNDAAIVIVREVADEAFFLRPENPAAARRPVDLDALCTAGIIEVIDLDDDELDLFVAYAAVVDDGEAATISAGVRRALPVATDDRRSQAHRP